MKAIVILENFEGEMKVTCCASNWSNLEDMAAKCEDDVNKGRALFDRYKTKSITYYDNDGDEYDIYLREKI